MLSFRDLEGQEWHPVLTAGVLRDWERKTGVSFFKGIFDVAQGMRTVDVADPSVGIAALRPLFSSTENLLWLAYYACRERGGERKVREPGTDKEISFDDFCDRIAPRDLAQLSTLLLNAFVAQAAPGDEGGTGETKGPFARGNGKTSTS